MCEMLPMSPTFHQWLHCKHGVIPRHAIVLDSRLILMHLCRVKQVLIAQAQAEKIRKIGEAEASSIVAIGKADAERMRLKAAGYRQYGEAAKMAMVLDALPKVTWLF